MNLDYEEDSRASYEPAYSDIPEEHLVIVDDFTDDAQQQLKSGDYSKVNKVVDHILEVNNCQLPKIPLTINRCAEKPSRLKSEYLQLRSGAMKVTTAMMLNYHHDLKYRSQ